jgi:hypothetical protein
MFLGIISSTYFHYLWVPWQTSILLHPADSTVIIIKMKRKYTFYMITMMLFHFITPQKKQKQNGKRLDDLLIIQKFRVLHSIYLSFFQLLPLGAQGIREMLRFAAVSQS